MIARQSCILRRLDVLPSYFRRIIASVPPLSSLISRKDNLYGDSARAFEGRQTDARRRTNVKERKFIISRNGNGHYTRAAHLDTARVANPSEIRASTRKGKLRENMRRGRRTGKCDSARTRLSARSDGGFPIKLQIKTHILFECQWDSTEMS